MRHRSTKLILPLDKCITKYRYTFPKQAANSKDPVTGKQAISLSINLERVYYPVEEEVQLEYRYWSLLIDIDFPYFKLEKYDPIKQP